MNKREIIHDILARYSYVDSTTGFAKLHKRTVPEIKKVVFNDPATIIFWQDGTKTVVKTQNDEPFDPEKGMAMAITKKALGNEGNYFNVIKPHVEEYRTHFSIEMNADALTLLNDNKPVYRVDGDGMGPVEADEEERPWRIWTKIAGKDGVFDKVGCSVKSYKHKSSATRAAKKLYEGTDFEWIVSRTRPWN